MLMIARLHERKGGNLMEKKKMKLWKIILLVVLAIFILFSIHVIRNFIIISDIVNLSKEYATKTNYIANVYSIQNNGVNITKSYNKDGKYLSLIQTKVNDNNGNNPKLTVYKADNEGMGIIQTGDKKIAILNNNVIGWVHVVTFESVADMNILQKLLFSSITKISTEKCDNKECYYMELYKDWKIWLDKENGTIVREINGGIVTERNYEFDVVKDEDIVKPDISDCEIQK